ncbi:L-alanine-DL-glutamate epimerase [Fulvivirga imtechensis AK7]|uniref:Dipeptide epimerase n=1 Tax=Fulvivirga imtechensis AK7 TaxID=1237149 RepID=L8JKW3_9BACT|nr:dipeptide epimerase [Fulvivirga imtechensis]ELR68853.1 L-alanine-DL-glutamate epimerase [Fulvivirga imtechensis AK7]
MKIESIEVWRMNLGNTRPYTIAFKTVDDVDCVFVKLNLENSTFGLGAGNPSQQVVGESLDDTLNTLSEENLEFLIGRDIREFYGLLDEVVRNFPKTPAARAALDIAIHDAFTKHLGVPLAMFLGQKIRSMATSVTIGIKNVEDTLKEAQEYYEMGFRVLKVKTGKDVDEDIERMVKLREVYGNQMIVRVDANQGYDVAALKKFYDKTGKLDIELIEQPTPAMDIQLLKQLPDPIKAIIAADESLLSPKDAFTLASPPGASGIFNIKLMKSGGIYPGRQIAMIADVSGTDLMWGCNDESAVSISAALHTALCFSNTKYLDLDGSLDLVVDAVSGGFQIKDGWMSVTDKPGLGVELLQQVSGGTL